MGKIKILAASVLAITTLVSCSVQTQDPTSIENTKTSESSQSEKLDKPAGDSTYDADHPLNVDEASARLEECVNLLTEDNLGRSSQVMSECFLSYPAHLPVLFGMRSVSDLSVSRFDIESEDTHEFSADVNLGDNVVAEVKAYYVDDLKQFKIIRSQMTKRGEQLIDTEIYKRAKVELR